MDKNVAYQYQRIDYIDRDRKAYIMYADKAVGEIHHEFSSDSGEYDWVIKIYWDTWDKLKSEFNITEIAGIDMDTRQDEYIRRYEPEFVTQRIPPRGRRDVRKLLEDLNIQKYDSFEILCRTHGKCGNDDFYVSRTPDKVIDINKVGFDYDIPEYDTMDYGWI